jgi:hypothetical protein
LQSYDLQWSPELSVVLRNGFKNDIEIAKEVARIAQSEELTEQE